MADSCSFNKKLRYRRDTRATVCTSWNVGLLLLLSLRLTAAKWQISWRSKIRRFIDFSK